MRCPDCQKFVSFDTERDPEDLDLTVDDEGSVSGSVRIVNACQECGQDLTEAVLDVEVDLTEDVEKHRDDARKDHEEEQAKLPEDERVPFDETIHDTLTLESSEATREERYQTHDRRGKPITRSRYQRHYYGAAVTVTVACKCGETFEATNTTETQASGMESLV